MMEHPKLTLYLIAIRAFGFVLASEELGNYTCVGGTTSWRPGYRVKIKLLIHTTIYPSECDVANGMPVFLNSTYGDRFDSLYTPCIVVNDIRNFMHGTCNFARDSPGCGCVAHDDRYYHLEYNFVFAGRNHRWWRVDVLCGLINIKKFHLRGTGCSYMPDKQNKAISLICPQPLIIIGRTNTLFCTINYTALSADGCQHIRDYVIFAMSNAQSNDSSTYPLCFASLHDCDTNKTAQGCRCVKHTAGGIRRYQMDFYGDARMPIKAGLDCHVPCLPKVQISKHRTATCNHLDFSGVSGLQLSHSKDGGHTISMFPWSIPATATAALLLMQ